MKALAVLVGKELRIEARSREMVSGSLVLTFLILFLASLAWGDALPAPDLAAGVLWIAVTFGGTLSLSRSVHRERDSGTWEALALLPVDWGLIYLAKVAVNLVVLCLVEAFALVSLALFFEFPVTSVLADLIPVLVLAPIGFAACGTLLAAVSAHGRAREILLPILLFPFLVPLLMMETQATMRVLAGASWLDVASELQLLVALDAIFLAIGWLTFDYLLSD